ncbi:MAG: hypothetical protein ACLTER_10985 [Ruminococcus sp.]
MSLGKCVITITDIYGQKLLPRFQLPRSYTIRIPETSYRHLKPLTAHFLFPAIKSIDYGDGWVDVNCPGTFSQSDPYVGYEGYLSYNDKFAYSVRDTRTIGED